MFGIVGEPQLKRDRNRGVEWSTRRDGGGAFKAALGPHSFMVRQRTDG